MSPMKHRPVSNSFALSLCAIVGLLAASRPLLAAAPKTDARTAALVAALQAVSPDPLGGQLGRAVVRPAAPAQGTVLGHTANQSARAETDHRAYLVWKRTQKS